MSIVKRYIIILAVADSLATDKNGAPSISLHDDVIEALTSEDAIRHARMLYTNSNPVGTEIVATGAWDYPYATS